jgi:hypothetical protein
MSTAGEQVSLATLERHRKTRRKTTTEFARWSLHAGATMTSDITRRDAGDHVAVTSLSKSELVRAQCEEMLERPERGRHYAAGSRSW